MAQRKVVSKNKMTAETAVGDNNSAVLEVSGHQFLVKEGSVLSLDNQRLEPGKFLESEKVLLIARDGSATFGQPYLKGVKVKLEILGNFKGPKLDIYKYKAKSRYRKHIGYRSSLTKVKVISITSK